MLTKLIEALGDPADVRSVAAIVAGVLVTIFGHSAQVASVVDASAGLIVAIDTAFLRKKATA